MNECCLNARRGHGVKNKKGKEMVRNVEKSSWRRGSEQDGYREDLYNCHLFTFNCLPGTLQQSKHENLYQLSSREYILVIKKF